MKLKPNTYYKTRDGSKVYLFGRVPEDSPCPYKWVGLYYHIDKWYISSWKEDGGYSNGGHLPSECDIIEEWREPIKIEGWINVYPKDEEGLNPTPNYLVSTFVFDTKEEADEHASSRRIACIKISGVEGEE